MVHIGIIATLTFGPFGTCL